MSNWYNDKTLLEVITANLHYCCVRKTTYFAAGIGFLAIVAIIFSIYDNTTKMENKISETAETIKPVEVTGTPADKYTDPQKRKQHCGSSDFKSNQYIREFEIPTPCTQPISIVTDSENKIWFTQSNTGNIAMFDPISEKFTEYQNDKWTSKGEVMMWGIQYTQDNEIWFTDEESDSIWKFSISEKNYSKFDFPSESINAFPQKISLFEDNFLINDFTGEQVVILSHAGLDNNKTEYTSIAVPEGFFTSQASADNNGNVWFVMWKYQKEATLVKINPATEETKQFSLPTSIGAPNGVSVGPENNVWIADTAGNSFYKFIPESMKIIEFVTTKPPVWTYGNSSGLIKTPITRPYWNSFDSDGNMWFNQQTANRLAVFDPRSESLIEYDIPSKNPTWGDCGDIEDCGLAQSFGFTFLDDQVWFTEWVENNIGVLDTTVTLPISIEVKHDDIQIRQGEQKEIIVTLTPQTNQKLDVVLAGNTNSESIEVNISPKPTQIADKVIEIPVTISVSDDSHKGVYKVLIGTQLQDVSVSSYVTVMVV